MTPLSLLVRLLHNVSGSLIFARCEWCSNSPFYDGIACVVVVTPFSDALPGLAPGIFLRTL